MSYYPTEEEEFECMYADELEALEELERDDQVGPLATQNPNKENQSNASIINSPHTSQSVYSQDFRKTPANKIGTNRITSTPFTSTQRVNNRLLNQFSPRVSNIASPSTIHEDDNFYDYQEPAKKRRLDYLFGDIRDLDEDEEERYYQYVKKTKSQDEIDQDDIRRILERRKYLYDIASTDTNSNSDKVAQVEALRKFKQKNLAITLPAWPALEISGANRKKLFVRFHDEEFEKEQIKELKSSNQTLGLLGDKRDEVWSAAQKFVSDGFSQSHEANVVETVAENCHYENDRLWVEKYKPKSYRDLLSDEAVNKRLLYWMKTWDKVVFGKEFKIQEDVKGQVNSFNKRTGRFVQNGGWTTNRRNNMFVKKDLDEYGRPHEKIALLVGPPGLGKTMLAHTVARHAGYAVQELNASDDRNVENFRTLLENATQMKSVLTEDQRPVCLILDEIDGAPSTSIDYLLKFAYGTSKGMKKDAKQPKILKRPIICICNDLYAPALRTLRQQAIVLQMPTILSTRLGDRLKEIADNENLNTNLTALIALANKSGNDIRACVSTLQFYGNNKREFTLEDALKLDVGLKDRNHGLFTIWQTIFQIKRLDLKDFTVTGKNTVSSAVLRMRQRAKDVTEIIQSCDNVERLMNGVHENFLVNSQFKSIPDGVEWFIFFDTINTVINQQQNYTLYPYIMQSFTKWHLLFGSYQYPKLHFPSKGYENYKKTKTLELTMKTLRKRLSPNVRGTGINITMLSETIPLLRHIMSPYLRSALLQLLSPKEKDDLVTAVNTLCDLGVAFIQTRMPDGSYQYKMDPDLETICVFNDIPVKTATYLTKQLIAKEVELEQIRRAMPKQSGPLRMANEANENNLKIVKNKPGLKVPQKDTVYKDFFGRIVHKDITSGKSSNCHVDEIVKSPIWYHFKEGFNNAVRKRVKISDLLH